ncbi:sugar porter family MFS transporter [Niallia alba]|uniref:sugar porter family MFS transporter n=1 Tax=Niallia alba TaxID=2729105 RepID=UPI002E24E6EE|nr:sugar porter family MFS transporter [Niallia alba]
MNENTGDRTKSYTYVIYFFGALGGMLFGYDTGVISGALLFIKKDLGLTPTLEGLVVSGVMFGAIVGALIFGHLSDRFGRKKIIIALGVLFTIGGLGTAFPPNVIAMIFYRVLLGIAVGGASGIVPMYLAELSPAKNRGAVTAINSIMIATGMLMAYVVNHLLTPSGNWHIMLGFAVVPSILLVIGMLFMPESPKWLAQHDRITEAEKVLNLTHTTKSEVEHEIFVMKSLAKKHEKGRIKDIFEKWCRPIIVVGITIAILQQLTGTNTIFYYAPTILSNSGLGDSSAIASTIGIGVVNLIMTIVGVFLVDRWGRKKMLLLGSIGMTISLLALSIAEINSNNGAIIMILSMCFFMVSYSTTWGMVAWVVLAEIFPMKIRGVAMGVCTFCLWTTNGIISLAFPISVDRIGVGPIFMVFALVCLGSYFFVKKYLPETKGKTLEEIELDFRFKENFEQRESYLKKI